jgi:outer membrane protein
MESKLKKALFFGAIFFAAAFCSTAQQITRFAVVDLAKIYTTFQSDSRPIRALEEASARVQAEVDKRTAELQALVGRKAEAELEGNDSAAASLAQEITKKTDALKVYYETETRKLEEQKGKLSVQNDFAADVYRQIKIVAESEGYSMVLNIRDNKGILWYSQAIDITDKVINSLKAKNKR